MPYVKSPIQLLQFFQKCRTGLILANLSPDFSLYCSTLCQFSCVTPSLYAVSFIVIYFELYFRLCQYNYKQ